MTSKYRQQHIKVNKELQVKKSAFITNYQSRIQQQHQVDEFLHQQTMIVQIK